MEANFNNGTKNLLGVGIYSLSDVARYIQVDLGTVRTWVLGRNSRATIKNFSKTDQYRERTIPYFINTPAKIENETILTFADMIELRMVKLFRDRGVSMPVIKTAARSAARLWGTDHPFSSIKLQTDGKRIFADIQPKDVEIGQDPVDDKRIVQDLAELQVVMGDIVRVYFKDTDYDDHDDQMALRWWWLGKGMRAVIDPKRSLGHPIDGPTGVPLSVLNDLIEAGETAEEVADWYDVPIDAVDTAVEFYNKILPPKQVNPFSSAVKRHNR